MLRNFLILLCISLLSACQADPNKSNFIGQDITGAVFETGPALTDHTGQSRAMSDFQDKAVVMFFGYTHCPDICPTTMTDLKQTMKLLGKDAEQVQVIFITVDPERDTQEVLAQYVPYFDQRFIGLTGSASDVETTLTNYKVFAGKVQNEGETGYTIDHSAGLYVFDKTGAVRVYIDHGQTPAEIAHDIKQLL